jgi:hypothetical protein
LRFVLNSNTVANDYLDDALVEDVIDGLGNIEEDGLDKEEDSEDESSEENDTSGEEEEGDPTEEEDYSSEDGSGDEQDDSSEEIDEYGSVESDESRYMFADDYEAMINAYKNGEKSIVSSEESIVSEQPSKRKRPQNENKNSARSYSNLKDNSMKITDASCTIARFNYQPQGCK